MAERSLRLGFEGPEKIVAHDLVTDAGGDAIDNRCDLFWRANAIQLTDINPQLPQQFGVGIVSIWWGLVLFGFLAFELFPNPPDPLFAIRRRLLAHRRPPRNALSTVAEASLVGSPAATAAAMRSLAAAFWLSPSCSAALQPAQ